MSALKGFRQQLHEKILGLLAILVIAVSLCPVGAAASETPSNISVAYCRECVPFQFTNAEGDADGMIIDFWRLWSKKTGITVEFVPFAWGDTLTNVGEGKVDAHAGLFFSKARSAYLDYGAALTKTDTHVFFHKDIAFPKTISELKAFRTAVLTGDFIEGWLQERLGRRAVVSLPGYQAILDQLKSGELKVFAADTPTALYHLGRTGLLADFRHDKARPLYTSEWFVAVKKGNGALLKVIDAGMKRINAEERLMISRTWASGKRSTDPTSVIIAIDSDYPPLTSLGIDGSPQGLLVDIWREWGKTVGRTVHFKAATWKQTLEDVRNGEADIHSGLFKSDERAAWMDFSQPIQMIKTGLYTKLDSQVGASLAALHGKKVGVVAGTYQARLLEEKHPDIKLYKVAERADYLIALIGGKIDAIIDEVPTVDAVLARFSLSSAVIRRKELYANAVHAGVRKENKALLKLVNEGLNDIPRERLAAIEAQWIANPEDRFFLEKAGVVRLSNEEREWIAAHPVISIAATPDWPPFEWQDENSGEHLGISADFMKLAAEKVGLRLMPEFGQWGPLVEKLKNKQIDVAPGLNQTPKRAAYLLFTKPFIESFSVIFTATDRGDIKVMADLAGKTVALEKGYSLHEVLAQDYPKIKVKPVERTIDALQAIASGEVDAYIGNQLVGSYLVRKYLIENVKTTGFFDGIPGRYRFGVRDDWPVLRSILDKGLAAITEDERNRIIRTYTGLQLDMGKRVRLTDSEREWLGRHPTARLGIDTNWPPFEFVDKDGTYSGLSSSYIEILSKRLKMAIVRHQNIWDI